MLIFALILVAVSVWLGGFLGLKLKNHSHLLLGAAAGLILGMISFELLPESLELIEGLGYEHTYAMIAFLAGFLGIHIFEKRLAVHSSHEHEYAEHSHVHAGKAQTLAVIGHAFFDGIAIGLGFQVSSGVGMGIAFAVLAHDFCDGFNTVAIMAKHQHETKSIYRYLALTAIAPVIGGVLAVNLALPEIVLPLALAFFSGMLMYIAASDILPEAHAKHSSWKVFAITVLGVVIAYLTTQLIGHGH